MDSIELIRKAKDPTSGGRTETCTVWVDDRTFCWCRTGPQDCDEGEEEFKTEEKAENAAHAMLAALKKEGFAPRERVAPPPPQPPSQAKKGATKPAWFGSLPKPVLRQHAKLRKAAQAQGLGHRFDEIEALMKLGMELRLKKAKAADLKGVVSRIGGEPDLPPKLVWPEFNGTPLSFVAQIVISADVKELDFEDLFPKAGVLSFFAQLDPNVPEYGEHGVVLYFATTRGLVRAAPPSPACVLKKAGVFTPKARLMVAPSEAPVVEELELNSEESENYHDEVFLGSLPEEGPFHVLLGWGSASTHREMEGKRFLAQFDSDRRIDFAEGDWQTLRFYVDGDVIDLSTLKTAVCTLMES